MKIYIRTWWIQKMILEEVHVYIVGCRGTISPIHSSRHESWGEEGVIQQRRTALNGRWERPGWRAAWWCQM